MNGVNPQTTILTLKGVNFHPYYFGEYSAVPAQDFNQLTFFKLALL